MNYGLGPKTCAHRKQVRLLRSVLCGSRQNLAAQPFQHFLLVGTLTLQRAQHFVGLHQQAHQYAALTSQNSNIFKRRKPSVAVFCGFGSHVIKPAFRATLHGVFLPNEAAGCARLIDSLGLIHHLFQNALGVNLLGDRYAQRVSSPTGARLGPRNPLGWGFKISRVSWICIGDAIKGYKCVLCCLTQWRCGAHAATPISIRTLRSTD